jgi:hypothetical protein
MNLSSKDLQKQLDKADLPYNTLPFIFGTL